MPKKIVRQISPGYEHVPVRTLSRLRHWYTLARTQAKHRREPWLVSWPCFLDLWMHQDQYLLRGTSADALVFTRRDWAGDWHDDNVEITTRYDQLVRMAFAKHQKKVYN